MRCYLEFRRQTRSVLSIASGEAVSKRRRQCAPSRRVSAGISGKTATATAMLLLIVFALLALLEMGVAVMIEELAHALPSWGFTNAGHVMALLLSRSRASRLCVNLLSG